MENAEELIRLIDQRVRAAQTRDRHWGTCVERDTTGPGAQVVFDGSTVAMPVKVQGTVFCREGDRVMLDRYGSDWVITGAWVGMALGEASASTLGPVGGSGTLTNASYVDVNEFTPFTFTKAYDLTFVRIAVNAACFANVAGGTSVRWGVRFTPQDASSSFTAQDYNVASIYFNNTGVHLQTYSAMRALGVPAGGSFGIPAGNYSVSLRWLRWGGTGNLQFDSGDYFMIECDEGIRTVQPFL